MAYNAVAAIDEVASLSGSDSSHSSSPVPNSFHQLRDADHLGGGSYLETARTDDQPSLPQLSSMIGSMTSTNYDVIDADDYGVDPSLGRGSNSLCRIPVLNTAIARQTTPDPPLRSASSDAPVPLNHPTPGLQSLQGAYTGNVARLEQSAERMSSSSADIGSEIRRMNLEQKRRSCSSASNSGVVRNGAFSAGSIASPLGSTMSTRQRSVSGGSRLAQVAEPDREDYDHVLEHLPAPVPILPVPQIPIYTQDNEIPFDHYDGHHGVAGDIDRPTTAASGDTYQQARFLFNDFDGVHFTQLERADSRRLVSLMQPPLASKPESYKEPQTGERMVYYPAPVPRMLNLPPKLSRKPLAEREKRRAHIISSIAADEGKLAAQSGPGEEQPNTNQKDNRLSKAPPQLRASVFFDPPSTKLEVEVKQDSAVATLEDILDASANAPVTAFTDHPYAGHVGSYVYGKSKRKTDTKHSGRHSQRLMGQHQSTPVGTKQERSAGEHRSEEHSDDGSPPKHHSEEADGSGSESHDEPSGSEEDSEDEEDYVGPPNTLLAELELRKQELKQRRRTALPQYTPGMKNTLLELDAMAQQKSDKRRRRPVTLAWDNRDADDDDVPLALLYPDKTNPQDEDIPLGLLERRQFEENEPLSARRARLRGEPVPEKRSVTVHVVEASDPDAVSGDEGETLAERLRRLRGQNPKESDFAHDLLAEFDTRTGATPKEAEVAPEEETLAQRRIRLQKKQGAQPNAKNPRMRRSMAALSQQTPAHLSRQMSHDVLREPSSMQQYGKRMSMQSVPANMIGHTAQPVYPLQQTYGYNGFNMPGGCGPSLARQQPIDPTQRDVIDRWRQSIR